MTGVLDFEFASPDARAMDLAVGLYQFSSRSPFGIEMKSVEAYARGYATRAVLEPAEIDALPQLWQIRQVVSVIHRLGRWRQGVASRREVTDRVDRALLLEDWIQRQSSVLTATLADAMRTESSYDLSIE